MRLIFILVHTVVFFFEAGAYCCGSAEFISTRHHDLQCRSDGLTLSRETSEVADVDWENLGFGLIETDFMYVAKCGPDGNFSKGEVIPFGPIALSPSAGVINYRQVSEEASHLVSYLYIY